MQSLNWGRSLLLVLPMYVSGRDALTDPATRLASGIVAGVSRPGTADGSTYSIQDLTPAAARECNGRCQVPPDKLGALIVWCKDAAGNTLGNGSTTDHARFVDTPKTFIVDKSAGSGLTIDLERRDGRAVIADVH